MDVGDFLAEAQANNALYGNVSGGSTPSLTPELANAFAARYARALGAAAPAPGTGTGEPRMDATVRNQVPIPGQVNPTTQARYDQASMIRGAYQQAANNGMLAQAAATSAGQSALGTEQEAAAQAAQAEAAARQEELRGRLTEFESRLESVAHRRIDPEQYFGGFGGRLAASLAVALGELGRGLTGGDVNGPLGIINAAIERNIRAQEANLSNEQTGVANAGHALSTMRGILGDDAAAQAASRALHLAAAENRLMAMSSGLSGANAQLTARLREALGMERQAAQQMAAELAARGSQTTSVTVRGPESRVMGAVGRLQAANAPGASQGTQEAAQGQGRPTPQARPRTASERRTSGVSPQRSGARGPTAAQVTRAREVAESAAEYAAQNASAPQGWRPVPGDPSARARFNREMQSNEGRQAFGEIAAAVETWNRFVPRIVDANEEFGMETTNDDQRVALARQFRQEILDAYRVALTGAAAPEAELARIEDSLPDPGRVGFNQAWNSIRNVWRGRLAARLAVLQSEARNRFGVVPRTVMTERMAAQARNQREEFRGRGEQ
jgi:hypothetical protein